MKRSVCTTCSLLVLLMGVRSYSADLKPLSQFDVSSFEGLTAGKVSIREVRAGSKGVYILVCNNPVAIAARILFVSVPDSTLQRKIILPPTKEILGVDVDNVGNIYVLAAEGGNTDVLVYDQSGHLKTASPTTRFGVAITHVNGTPVVATRSEDIVELRTLRSVGETAIRLPVQARQRLLLASLPNGKLAVIEKTGGVVHIVDPAKGIESSFSPPVSGAPRGRSDRGRAALGNVVFSSVAATSSGSIYLTTGRYRLSTGAPLVISDAEGKPLESIRCSLPTFDTERSPGNPKGFMPASKIAIVGSFIVLASSTGKVGIYQR